MKNLCAVNYTVKYGENTAYALIFQGVWPAQWFLVVSEPLGTLGSLVGEQTGDHWVVAHANLETQTMTYWNSNYTDASWKKWKDVSHILLLMPLRN